MKTLFILILTIYTLTCDELTIIDMGTYTSHYCPSMRATVYTKHKLYHGGGDVKRDGMRFHDTLNAATNKEYVGSGGDIGHLVPAKDFAYNFNLEKRTFSHINEGFQYHNLNAGIWKTDEEHCRKLSEDDSILIYSGFIYLPNHKTIGNGISVPDSCFKYVISLSTNEVLLCRVYTNAQHDNFFREAKLEQIEKLINRKLG